MSCVKNDRVGRVSRARQSEIRENERTRTRVPDDVFHVRVHSSKTTESVVCRVNDRVKSVRMNEYAHPYGTPSGSRSGSFVKTTEVLTECVVCRENDRVCRLSRERQSSFRTNSLHTPARTGQ